MTARYALYTSALKNFGSPWLYTRLLFPKFLMGFLPINAMNMSTKFEVCSFARFWDNSGYRKNFGSQFRESLTIHTATFFEVFDGLFPIDAMNMSTNLKFVALPVSEIIGGAQKFGQSLDFGKKRAHFLQKFLMGFCSDGHCEYSSEIWSSYSFIRSWDNSDWSCDPLGGVANPQSWGIKGRKGSGVVPFERTLLIAYRLSIVTFPLSPRVSEILSFLCSRIPLFPTPTLVSPLKCDEQRSTRCRSSEAFNGN